MAILDFQSDEIYFFLIFESLPTKFRVNWPFGSGEEVQNKFLR